MDLMEVTDTLACLCADDTAADGSDNVESWEKTPYVNTRVMGNSLSSSAQDFTGRILGPVALLVSPVGEGVQADLVNAAAPIKAFVSLSPPMGALPHLFNSSTSSHSILAQSLNPVPLIAASNMLNAEAAATRRCPPSIVGACVQAPPAF